MSISLLSKYRKCEWLCMSPAELRETYFYGVRILDKLGKEISEDTYRTYILAAQKEIEGVLNIKLAPQVIDESVSFLRDEFESFGFIRLSYPVVAIYGLDGFIGEIRQIQYPKEWLSIRTTNDGETYFRQFYIVPNQRAANTGTLVYNGIIPYLGILGYSQIPNYWKVRYVTGYSKLPIDLMNLVGQMAAYNIFLIAGDLILNPGIGNQSLSIDGLSQSVSVPGGSGFNNRIKQYQENIKVSLERLRSKYKGITMSSM